MDDWRDDPIKFFDRWKIPYDDFLVLVQAIPAEVRSRYEKVLEVDDEVAITFAISEARRLGIVKDE